MVNFNIVIIMNNVATHAQRMKFVTLHFTGGRITASNYDNHRHDLVNINSLDATNVQLIDITQRCNTHNEYYTSQLVISSSHHLPIGDPALNASVHILGLDPGN